MPRGQRVSADVIVTDAADEPPLLAVDRWQSKGFGVTVVTGDRTALVGLDIWQEERLLARDPLRAAYEKQGMLPTDYFPLPPPAPGARRHHGPDHVHQLRITPVGPFQVCTRLLRPSWLSALSSSNQ
ncbi:hypothetical protein OTB20_41255 [Streptomyces sp. H27-H1]|uniref:hypothetical protein n=1 Tax=Streptomyces sp. H27-H1 TaxID=2996461 RepID=UPI00226E6A90|nr:hypothetical protein [Streptomyces sp. H27-H1]MCY0932460.1 hypothetical protein [Streptomyces sp. H27-H1]